MPDLRYHLISLISVFLALAVGILLGVALADRGVVTEQLRNQIGAIEKQVDQQRQRISERDREIDKLRERTTSDQDVMEGMSETMVSDRLIGFDVALVSGPWADDETVDAVEATLVSEAGASLTTRESLPEPTSLEATVPEDFTATYAQLAEQVLEGPSDSESPEVIVFVGGGEIPDDLPPGARDTLHQAQQRMFEVWLEAGARVVAAQPSTSDRDGEIELFQSSGIPSVDYADQPAGRAAVVELATGQDDGTYGTRSTASEPFPPDGS
jgi:hypothetical protein